MTEDRETMTITPDEVGTVPDLATAAPAEPAEPAEPEPEAPPAPAPATKARKRVPRQHVRVDLSLFDADTPATVVYRIEPDGMPEFGRGNSCRVPWEPDQTREQFQSAALAAIGAAESDENTEVIDG